MVTWHKVREFSEIELLIIERIMTACVQLLREPWTNVLDVHPRLERIETNSQFAQIISPSEMIAIVTISIKIGDVEGFMNICLPYITLEPVMDKLNTKFWYSNMQERVEMEYADTIESLIAKAIVPVKAILGKSVISVNDFSGLHPAASCTVWHPRKQGVSWKRFRKPASPRLLSDMWTGHPPTRSW